MKEDLDAAPSQLVQRVLKGDIRAAGRLMRQVDDNLPQAQATLAHLFKHTGDTKIIGITGNPGAGKSTLVNQLISAFRKQDKTVGCIAVDPTSPFSGGAILGDRVRMQQHALDPGVFIRSVATRGNLGGISRSTPAIVQILDAMDFDVIIIETVGVGQDEIDIVRLADTSVVINVPGLGDDIQASKAGIMEIADILVINKADREGVKRLRRELRTMVEIDMMGQPETSWHPTIMETVSTSGEGIEELMRGIEAHQVWLDEHGQTSEIERNRLNHYISLIATGRFERATAQHMKTSAWQGVLDRVQAREQSPHAAAHHLLELIGMTTP